MIYLAWLGLFAALTFLGYRSHQYRQHIKRSRGAVANTHWHPHFGNSSRK